MTLRTDRRSRRHRMQRRCSAPRRISKSCCRSYTLKTRTVVPLTRNLNCLIYWCSATTRRRRSVPRLRCRSPQQRQRLSSKATTHSRRSTKGMTRLPCSRPAGVVSARPVLDPLGLRMVALVRKGASEVAPTQLARGTLKLKHAPAPAPVAPLNLKSSANKKPTGRGHGPRRRCVRLPVGSFLALG